MSMDADIKYVDNMAAMWILYCTMIHINSRTLKFVRLHFDYLDNGNTSRRNGDKNKYVNNVARKNSGFEYLTTYDK